MLTMRPRTAAGEISAMYMGATTSAAPTPNPDKSRARMSMVKSLADADISADTVNTTAAACNMRRRP